MSESLTLHNRVKSILYSLTGITLAENKDIMIANRLHKLIRDTNFDGDIESLLDAIEKGEHQNIFINSFTTNKTHFFREDFHFEDLLNRVLPSFSKPGQKLNMYCSAAATGEEPYSMAITLLKYEQENACKIKSSIIATDIDTNVLQYAANGVYRFSKSSKEFPSWIKPQKYFLKRTNKTLGTEEVLIKVKPALQKLVQFQVMNLNDSSYPFAKEQFDVVFCRNVLIYFTNEDQAKILKKLFSHLKIQGTLYIGHSETPQGLAPYIKKIGPNIFIKVKDLD